MKCFQKECKHSVWFLFACVLLMQAMLVSCNTVDDDRIPSMPVSINLSTQDLWNTYGVSGIGSYTKFIAALREPRNFPFTDRTATGYGGVLLISGINPFTYEAGVPLAYDLACPVECKPDVRVNIVATEAFPVAVCPVCGSHYDVVEFGGSPTSGPALSRKLGLRRYECRENIVGSVITGYYIMNI